MIITTIKSIFKTNFVVMLTCKVSSSPSWADVNDVRKFLQQFPVSYCSSSVTTSSVINSRKCDACLLRFAKSRSRNFYGLATV